MSATDYVYGRNTLNLADLPYVNATGSTISKGMALKLDTSHKISGTQPLSGMTPVTAVTDRVLGIAVQNVPTGQNGTMQVGGVGVAIADANAITTGNTLGASGSVTGDVAPYTATDPYLGVAMSDTANAADPVLVLINPGLTA
jgi:Uncharacterized conserved protein (DUF2190)